MSDQKCPKTGPRRCQTAPGALRGTFGPNRDVSPPHGTLHGTIEGSQGEHCRPGGTLRRDDRRASGGAEPRPHTEEPPRTNHTLNT